MTESAPHSRACDIYALGIVMWEIMTGESPYKGWNTARITAQVILGNRPELPADLPQSIQDCIKQAWHKNPKERQTAQQLVLQLQAIASEIEKSGAGKEDESRS